MHETTLFFMLLFCLTAIPRVEEKIPNLQVQNVEQAKQQVLPYAEDQVQVSYTKTAHGVCTAYGGQNGEQYPANNNDSGPFA